MLVNFIRGVVKNHPEIKLKLKKANSKQTPFQFVYQMFTLTIMSLIAFGVITFTVFKKDLIYFAFSIVVLIALIPVIFKFLLSTIDVQISKYGRLIDGDLMFVSEYFLVSLESGMPLGNAIKKLSDLDRPGAQFFKRIYLDFKTGKDLEKALADGALYAPTKSTKNLIKKLKDSLEIGVDLREILINFIHETSEKKVIEIKGYSKKLNPLIMMYLLMGIVIPSLGVTFLILGAAMVQLTPSGLKVVLGVVFVFMFLFQYMTYGGFKFGKSTI